MADDAPAPPTPRRHALRGWWRRLLALTRLDAQAVCEESAGLGEIDYHDYPDTAHGQPSHFELLTCKRCGKRFLM